MKLISITLYVNINDWISFMSSDRSIKEKNFEWPHFYS